MKNDFDISLPVIGCDGCMNTAGALGCPTHGHRVFYGGVENGQIFIRPITDNDTENFIREVNKINYQNILRPINL
jgi:hypothetical protein